MAMTDPIGGRHGALVLSGWVAEAPTGHDEAYLLLTTPDERAAVTMPQVAAGLGLTPGQVATSGVGAVVEIGADGWLTLAAGGERYSRPANAEWQATARTRRQVVLVVGVAPMPPGMDVDTYTTRHGDEAAIGLVPVV